MKSARGEADATPCALCRTKPNRQSFAGPRRCPQKRDCPAPRIAATESGDGALLVDKAEPERMRTSVSLHHQFSGVPHVRIQSQSARSPVNSKILGSCIV